MDGDSAWYCLIHSKTAKKLRNSILHLTRNDNKRLDLEWQRCGCWKVFVTVAAITPQEGRTHMLLGGKKIFPATSSPYSSSSLFKRARVRLICCEVALGKHCLLWFSSSDLSTSSRRMWPEEMKDSGLLVDAHCPSLFYTNKGRGSKALATKFDWKSKLKRGRSFLS